MSSIDGDIGTINTSLNKATSDISVLQGQIVQKVEQTDIDSAISGLDSKFETIENDKADRLDTDALWTNITHMETSVVQLQDSITSKVERTEMDSINDTLAEVSSQVTQLEDSYRIDISQLSGKVSDAEDSLGQITSYLDFSSTGLNIGKSNSPLSINISNEQMDFLDNGTAVAYINGQKMYIENLQVLQSIIIGVHQIEKYNSGITFLRWVGEQ